MAFNIVVCVKSTPSTTALAVDPSTGKAKTDGIQFGINPFDEYAVEEAVRLKERFPGAKTTALALGPESADGAVREAIARGMDAGAVAVLPGWEESPYAAAIGLAKAILKLHAESPVHLVLFGKSTNDMASGLVGALVAARLDWPAVISVKKIDALDEKEATVHRMMEDGVDVVKTALPAVIGTVKEINEPRLPSLKGKMAAKKAALKIFKDSDLGVAAEAAAAVKAVALEKLSPLPPRPAGVRVDGASPQDKAKKLVEILAERRVI
jgi:electron transfer flavoprotein beta subunit